MLNWQVGTFKILIEVTMIPSTTVASDCQGQHTHLSCCSVTLRLPAPPAPRPAPPPDSNSVSPGGGGLTPLYHGALLHEPQLRSNSCGLCKGQRVGSASQCGWHCPLSDVFGNRWGLFGVSTILGVPTGIWREGARMLGVWTST